MLFRLRDSIAGALSKLSPIRLLPFKSNILRRGNDADSKSVCRVVQLSPITPNSLRFIIPSRLTYVIFLSLGGGADDQPNLGSFNLILVISAAG